MNNTLDGMFFFYLIGYSEKIIDFNMFDTVRQYRTSFGVNK